MCIFERVKTCAGHEINPKTHSFKCISCDEGRALSALKLEKDGHDIEKRCLTCQICNHIEITEGELQQHTKNSHRVIVVHAHYQCLNCPERNVPNLCMERCQNRNTVLSSLNSTEKEEFQLAVECDVCGCKFKRVGSCRTHYGLGQESGKLFRCGQCAVLQKRKGFYCWISECDYCDATVHALVYHLMVYHGIGWVQTFYKCEYCFQPLVDSSKLKNHKCSPQRRG